MAEPLSGKALKRKLAAKSDLKKCSLLRQRWPYLFNLKRPRPLVVGIHQEIIDQLKLVGIPPFYYLRELASYCNRYEYYLALLEQGTRYNLAGKGMQYITLEERKAARIKFSAVQKARFIKKRIAAGLPATDEDAEAAKRAKARAREKRKRENRKARKLATQKEETPQQP